jgi:hypothetical protein
MLYDSECWAVDRRIELSTSVAEMKMLLCVGEVTK